MAKKSRSGFLSSNALKLIAVLTMITDHAAVAFFDSDPLMRAVGRLAFPIFAFLIAEGARRTSSPVKYCFRLFLFALISEIPFDLAFHGAVLEFSAQNVYFTLLLGLISSLILRFLQKHNLSVLAVVSTPALSLAAAFIGSDYGAMGVVVITLMYVFSESAPSSRLAGYALTGALTSVVYEFPAQLYFIPNQLFAAAACIPMFFYNGKRGRRVNKYAFYLIYPLHLLVIALLEKILTA